MAADVKIGLLLSLVLVFVLAFALNRVPFSNDRQADGDLTPVMVSGPPGIRPEIAPEALPPEPVPQRPASQTPEPQATERFRTVLPEVASSEEAGKAIEPAKPPSTRSAPPVVRYIVCDGDSLAYIARKFYGPQQGNKRENVLRIFEANRGVLKSPDQIDVGQELVIPPLEASQPPRVATQGGAAGRAQTTAEQNIFPDTMFEKVDSIGKKHL